MTSDRPGIGRTIRAGVRRVFSLGARGRGGWERDVEDEIRLHLALRAEQLVDAGRSPNEAFAEAVRQFGPLAESRARLIEAARHREEHMQRTELLQELTQDVRFALRAFRRQPAWTAVTIATLALGIGATTAVFSVVSSLLLHTVSYPAADRIVAIDEQPTAGNSTGISISVRPQAPLVRAWREGAHSLEALEGYLDAGDVWIAARDGAEATPVPAAHIFPTFPSFAGRRLLAGRMFSENEVRSHAHVVVIGETLWRSRFAAMNSAIGQPLTIDDSTYTIIGVLPSTLHLPRPGRRAPEVWLPLDVHDDAIGMALVGRLREHTDIATAARELDSIAVRVDAAQQTRTQKIQFTTRIVSPSQLVHFHDTLLMLLGAVGLVLLVACANVAHLQLVRGATRSREMAVRVALGAGRARLIRQLITENVLVSVIGGIAGILLAWLGLRLIVALRPPALTELDVARLDGTTILVATAVSIGSGIAFGILGMLQWRRMSTHDALKEHSLNSSSTRAGRRFGFALVVAEMAMSTTLLVGASLLVRSVIRLQETDLGLDPRGLYSIQFDFPAARFATPASRASFLEELTTRLRHTPGVSAIAIAHVGPSGRAFAIGALEVDGEPAPSGVTNFIDENQVTPNFFATLRIPLVEGTTFTDTSDASTQVIVNAGFARKHWPRGQAIGHRIRVAFKGHGSWRTIVGVVADASPGGPTAEASAPMLYQPHDDEQSAGIYVRTTSEAAVAELRRISRSASSTVRPTIESLNETTRQATSAPRFIMTLLASFAVLAAVLAAVGLYGVMSYGVTQSTREIGIRVALGARHTAIVRLVFLRGVALAAVGACCGVLASRWATKLIEHQLYTVGRFDVVAVTGAVLTLIIAAMLASVIPTRRALAIDPMIAIRAD